MQAKRKHSRAVATKAATALRAASSAEEARLLAEVAKAAEERQRLEAELLAESEKLEVEAAARCEAEEAADAVLREAEEAAKRETEAAEAAQAAALEEDERRAAEMAAAEAAKLQQALRDEQARVLRAAEREAAVEAERAAAAMAAAQLEAVEAAKLVAAQAAELAAAVAAARVAAEEVPPAPNPNIGLVPPAPNPNIGLVPPAPNPNIGLQEPAAVSPLPPPRTASPAEEAAEAARQAAFHSAAQWRREDTATTARQAFVALGGVASSHGLHHPSQVGPFLSGRFYGELLETVTMQAQEAPVSPIRAGPKLGGGRLLEVVSMVAQARPPPSPRTERLQPLTLKDLDTGREVDILDAAAVKELAGAKSRSTTSKGPGAAGTLEQVVEAARRQATEELELSIEVLAHPPSKACVELSSILRLILILSIGSGAVCGE
jgi:hypothetical protein